MAAASINVMLAIHAKKTTGIDLYRPLRQYIALHYSEREAREAEDDLQSVQEMRSDIEKATDSLDSRRDLLQRYFRALCVMESRFPISNEREHVNTLTFTWYDAFKQNKKANQQNIHFEKAAIAFNLGAVYSQIALSADRSVPEGLKLACNSFQSAAGAFAFLRDNVSMKASSGSSTIDISVECAGMLERLMLAQAQECFFEKVLSDGKPSALCAKVARQVGLFYEEAHAALMLPPLSQHFDRSWVAHVQLKSAQFQAEACYRVSLELHEKENIAEEIARLKSASSMLADAKRNGRGVVGPLLDAVTKLDASVSRNLERAIRENDRVYLMRVPNSDSLPPLPAALLVKSSPIGEILDASREKMFANLVPDSSAKALSKYTEMLDEIIRVQAEKLQQESEITRVKLKDMNLPDSLLALEGGAALPDYLKDDVEAVQVDGGPAGLESEMAQLRDLRRVNEELLVQTEEFLEKEAREDAQIRAQFGTRWTRPQSSTLTKNLHDRANGFAANLKQATDSDRRIERAIKDNASLLCVLDVRPIESALPSLNRPMLSLNGNEDAVVGALRQKLAELDRLGVQRASLEDMLKDMKRQDNILPKLMTTSGSYEDLFKKELARYDPVRAEVARNVEAQQKLLQEIQVHNNAFAATFNLADYIGARERSYKQISAAIAKYREIRENINEGLKFYVTLQDAINNLKQQCSDYVMTRNIQSREMMEDLQRSIAGLSFKDSSNSNHVYPPPAPPRSQTSPNNPTAAPPYTHAQQSPPPPQHNPNPPYYPPNMPPPPYYSQQSQAPQHTYGQPAYPGWQGPYYNNAAQPPPSNTPQNTAQNSSSYPPGYYSYYKQ